MKSTQTAVNSERTADLEQKTIISHEDEKVALVLSLTLYGMGGGGIHPPWRFFLHCAKTFGTRELKLFDF